MEALGGGPAADQRLGEVAQLRPGPQGARCVRGGKRKALHREDVQPAAVGPRSAPQLQQSQDVQTGAETKLADHEAAAPLPSPGQAAAVQEHGPRFLQAPLAGEIDVVEDTRAGGAVLGPVEDRPLSHGPESRRAARGRPFLIQAHG